MTFAFGRHVRSHGIKKCLVTNGVPFFDRVQLHVMEIGTRNLTCSQVLTSLSTLNSTSSRPITEVKQRTSLVSTWMGDRLGIPGAVEHFSDFVVCFTVSLIFGHFGIKKCFVAQNYAYCC